MSVERYPLFARRQLIYRDPNILRHDSSGSSEGATSGLGLGCVKTQRQANCGEQFSSDSHSERPKSKLNCLARASENQILRCL
tara:strand:- start:222 stop:470 length:249 start_codon:yes stop_codon:yes gene_type:complete